MFLYYNPWFFSNLLARACSIVQEFAAVSWPPNLASAVQDLVIHTSNTVPPIGLRSDSKLSCNTMTVWAPPISFVPPPPLPPPPPSDQVFTSSDWFPSPSFIPFPEESDTFLVWPFTLIAGLLGFGIVILLAVWTCKTSNLNFSVHQQINLARQRFGQSHLDFGARRALLLSAPKFGKHKFVPVLLYLLNTAQRLLRPLLNSLLRTIGFLLHHISKALIQASCFVCVKLVTVGIPWILETGLSLVLWVIVQACRITFQAASPPTPLLQPEKTADNPIPPQPPQPLPPPPTWTTWLEIILEGAQPTSLNPKDIIASDRIGRGGFGRVSLGLNQATKERVAIKRVRKQLLGEGGEHLMVDEIRVMNRLRASEKQLPFPRLFGSYIDDHDYILVMDYIPGGTMWTKLQQMGGYLHRPLALFYAGQLLLATHHLHQLGILHRDIKPDNILLDSCGNIVLSDFGLAKAFNVNAKGGKAWAYAKGLGGDSYPLLWPTDSNPHIVNLHAGTELYSAPEVQASEDYSYGVDYWSFAMTFFEFLTGILPWAIDEDEATYVKPLTVDLEGDNEFRRVILAEEERDFFAKAFVLDPFERWMTVGEIKAHSIWQRFDWDALSHGTLPAPIPREPVVKIVGGRVHVGRHA